MKPWYIQYSSPRTITRCACAARDKKHGVELGSSGASEHSHTVTTSNHNPLPFSFPQTKYLPFTFWVKGLACNCILLIQDVDYGYLLPWQINSSFYVRNQKDFSPCTAKFLIGPNMENLFLFTSSLLALYI